MDDNELLDKIQQGDHAAFSLLVERHHQKFYHLAYRYLGHQDEAEDMVQIAFLKLWEDPFRWNKNKGTKFTTWFYRVVINLCLDHKKKFKSLLLLSVTIAMDQAHLQKVG